MKKQNQSREAVIYVLSLGLLVTERTLKYTKIPSAIVKPASTKSLEF